jgi:predicted AlkP superfamily pyrophosphatase or phosphodiesterase
MYKLGMSDLLTGNPICIFRVADNTSIPFDPANTDYQKYLEWLAEGNEPEPADQPE